MSHYVQFRNQMTNANDEDLMALAMDLFGSNHGIIDTGSYEVVQNSPTGMSVLINDGKAYVYSSTLGYHMRTILDTFAATASKAVLTIDSNSSGSTRYDLICIKIDTAAIADDDASNIATLVVVKGTPGAGVPATPANYFKLAEITVADGETTITTAEITDRRILMNPAWKTISIGAKALTPTTTAPCGDSTKLEAGTNDVDYDYLPFDDTTEEHAYINITDMPIGWDGGPFQFRVKWTSAAGAGGETVAWGLKGRAYADGDAIDQAMGTEVVVTDDWQADADVHATDWSSDVTMAGSPAGAQFLHLVISRKPGNAADDHTGDARLLGISLRFRRNKYSDVIQS